MRRIFPNDISRMRFGRLAALALAAAMLAGTASHAVSQDLSSGESDDIERFCSNIADAARDRRYSLQRAELETLRADIEERIVALEDKRTEYEEWLKRREDFLAQARDNLVEIYSRMRPDAAAERLAQLNLELAAGILMKINARQAGTILNEMETEAAATVTSIMASATREQDPT